MLPLDPELRTPLRKELRGLKVISHNTAGKRCSRNGQSAVKQLCALLCSAARCVQLRVTPWTEAPQAPLSMGLSRQEYCSGLPWPPPGDLPNQGSNPGLLHCRWTPYHLSQQGSSHDCTINSLETEPGVAVCCPPLPLSLSMMELNKQLLKWTARLVPPPFPSPLSWRWRCPQKSGKRSKACY